MFAYSLKNLKSLFSRQKLLSLLLVINIIVSCLVMCFSYGLYQNYNMVVENGEEEELQSVNVLISNEDVIYLDNYECVEACNITPQMLIAFLHGLSDDTKENLQELFCEMWIESPLFGMLEGNSINKDELEDDLLYYSDDAEPFWGIFAVSCRIDGDNIFDAWGELAFGDSEHFFTDEQYNNGEKVAVLHDEFGTSALGLSPREGYKGIVVNDRIVNHDAEKVKIGNEYFIISKFLPVDEMFERPCPVLIPLTAMPENGRAVIYMNDETSMQCFTLNFKKTLTRSQYDNIKNVLTQIMGDDVFLPSVEFTDSTEIYYYKTIMLISAVIAVLAAINMAILYRYILEKRSSELAIFRICGCSKSMAIVSYLLECTVINAPLFALTQLVYHKLIMPRLTSLFPNMAGAYSFKLYAAILGIYIGASMLIMLIMIVSTIHKHSLVTLTSAPKATNKFGIMKIFEVIQFATVLAMIVVIVSAIVSRYELLTPFEPYLERKGYLVTADMTGTWPNELENALGSSDNIFNTWANAYDGDTMFEGIAYSDEFITAYAPPLLDGVWLSDTDITYENSGYIPVVLTYCDGRYKVGDEFGYDSSEYYNAYGELVPSKRIKYKVVGILKDKVNIAAYVLNNWSLDTNPFHNDFRDIYEVFSDSFEDRDYILIRLSDEYACFNGCGQLQGTQFIFCDNMDDMEYAKIGGKLQSYGWRSVKPLSVIYKNSMNYIYEQMYTIFPIAVCIFILTIISTVSISAIYTKRQLRNYAIFYICGARWRTCALKSLKNGAITCAVSAALSALILVIGKATLLKETVISFSVWHFAVCTGVIILYLVLSMIMPLSIIGSSEPREVLKDE